MKLMSSVWGLLRISGVAFLRPEGILEVGSVQFLPIFPNEPKKKRTEKNVKNWKSQISKSVSIRVWGDLSKFESNRLAVQTSPTEQLISSIPDFKYVQILAPTF